MTLDQVDADATTDSALNASRLNEAILKNLYSASVANPLIVNNSLAVNLLGETFGQLGSSLRLHFTARLTQEW